MARCQISFVKFILEAYDNVAVLSTLDPRQAVVQVTIAPGFESMVDSIMTSLGGDFDVVPVDGTTWCGDTNEWNRLPADENG